jgi:hypothetical protein
MNHCQNTKSVLNISPGVAGVNSAATHTVAIDCLGFDALSIDVAYRSLANTSAPSVLGLRFADADAATKSRQPTRGKTKDRIAAVIP